MTTQNAPDILVAGNYVETGADAAGRGFTIRVITPTGSDICEDRVVTAAGQYNAVGFASRSYNQATDVGDATSASFSQLTSGDTYYFAVTAYNAAGIESPYSNEVSYQAP